VRRIFQTSLAIGLLLTANAKAISADPQEMLKAELRIALDQLNAPSLTDRTRAEERLIALGPAVLPLLPAPELVSAVSAKQALKRVRIQLETISARQSIASSKLTLNGTYSISELSNKIEVQTRNRLILSQAHVADPSQKHTVNWLDRPFWDAITDLERQQLSIEFSQSHSAYAWKTRLDNRTVHTTAGCFRLTAMPIHVRSVPQNAGRVLHARVSISAEPRLRPLLLRYKTTDFSLENGYSIQPFDPESKIEVPIGDAGRVCELNLSFKDRIKQEEREIETLNLKGQVHLFVATGEIPIEFKEFGRAQGISRRHGDVSVSLTKVRLKKSSNNKIIASVRLRVAYESSQQTFESHQLWVLHNRVFIKTPKGDELPPYKIETLYQQDGLVELEYLFNNLPKESASWSCHYIAPTLIADVPLAFTLSAIPVNTNQ